MVSAMNAGGAETFLMKIYRNLDKTLYQMDFCVNINEEGFYDAEIEQMGGKIYHIPSKSENRKGFKKGLYRIVKDNGYKNVMRVTSNAMGFYDLHIAKKAGATNCIARSSNSSDGGSLKSKIAHTIGKILFKKAVDVKIAPSDLAAIYTFGKKDYNGGKVKMLNNGIDFDEYAFSKSAREDIRADFGIADDCFLLGHIGRFSEQKNHKFLLEVFDEFHKNHQTTKLLLVGDGKLKTDIESKITEYGLQDSVIFTGVRKDVPALLSAMDLFVFPSLYEGMPNILIEAQASGLDCLVSDTITSQVVLTSKITRLPLNALHDWINALNNNVSEYEQIKDNITDSRLGQRLPGEYDIREVTKSFVSYFV